MPFFLSSTSSHRYGNEESLGHEIQHGSLVEKFTSAYEFTVHMLTIPQNPQVIHKIQQVREIDFNYVSLTYYVDIANGEFIQSFVSVAVERGGTMHRYGRKEHFCYAEENSVREYYGAASGMLLSHLSFSNI